MSATAIIPKLQLESEFITKRYIMLSFTYTLVGVGPVCNTDCIVVFTKRDITVFLPGGKPILIGYREKELP